MIRSLIILSIAIVSVGSRADVSVQAVECRARSGIGHVMEKIRAGGEVRVAYFGGSITEMDGNIMR